MTDELQRFCFRILGDGPPARAAAETASAAGGEDRLAGLRAAVAECRRQTGATAPASEDAPDGLAAAVARELAAAVAGLTPEQREALALRDLLGLSYGQIAAVTGDLPEDVGPLLAAARVGLRAQLRGGAGDLPDCPEHDRALRTIAARQDAEPAPAADDDWLIDHLGICAGCARDHAAMLEAAACYRAWGAADAQTALAGAGS